MGKNKVWLYIITISGFILMGTAISYAGPPETNLGFYDDVLQRFADASSGWASVIQNAALWLFWTLAIISMVWTFGIMALRKADLAEFFSEFVRFTIFLGFFLWLLRNGPVFADSIIKSLSQLGAEAGGLPVVAGQTGLTPSGIVSLGFDIFLKMIENISFWPTKFHLSMAGISLGIGMLIMLCFIGINMLFLLISAWMLCYAGIFFLGFGGSRWTSDMAINYYKTVLGLAIQILAMILLISVGKTFLDQYYLTLQDNLSMGNLSDMAALFVACLILLVLSNRIPPLLSGIITGSSINGGGIGSMAGIGTLAAAASMTAAAVATGGAALAAGGAAAAGGGQALMAAFKQASSNVAAGTDILSSLGGSGGGGSSSSDNSSGGSSGSTPFASAAGFSDSSSGGAGSGSSSQGTGSGSQSSGLAKVGRIATDATANLTKGAVGVAKNKVMASISQTTGGKIASAIKNQGSGAQEQQTEATPTFSENSISAPDSKEVDAESEIAAFRDRDTV